MERDDQQAKGRGNLQREMDQTTTLLVTLGTLILTLILYVLVPKGFFPVQDTGVILGISEAPEDTSFAAMADRWIFFRRHRDDGESLRRRLSAALRGYDAR